MQEERSRQRPEWANRVRRLLFERGESQKDILDCFGVGTLSGVTPYINGTRPLRVDQAQRLADYFGVSLEWLLNGPDDLAEEYRRQQELREEQKRAVG